MPRRYTLNNKIWLNSKYIKTKQNCKLEFRFFDLFQILDLVKSQVYKLKLPKNWRIYDVFLMLLLEQDITKKKQVGENVTQLEFEVDDDAKYKLEIIENSMIYVKKSEAEYLPRLYYQILQKNYSKKKNILKPVLAVQYFEKLVKTLYAKHVNKPIATLFFINTSLLIARLTTKPIMAFTKQKHG